MKEVLKVNDMSCNHCKTTILKAVNALKGIKSADINLSDKTLTVEFNESQTGLKEIKAAVEDAGYTVS